MQQYDSTRYRSGKNKITKSSYRITEKTVIGPTITDGIVTGSAVSLCEIVAAQNGGIIFAK